MKKKITIKQWREPITIMGAPNLLTEKKEKPLKCYLCKTKMPKTKANGIAWANYYDYADGYNNYPTCKKCFKRFKEWMKKEKDQFK